MKRLRNAILHMLAFLPLFAVQGLAQERAQGVITITGAITCVTAGSCVQLPVIPLNTGTITVQIVGTYTGTLSFEATADGSTYAAIGTCFSSSAPAASTTTTGIFVCGASGFTGFQVRASAAVTGAASVVIRTGQATPFSGNGAGTISGTVNVDPVANTIGLATGAKQDTGNTSLGTIVTLLQTPVGSTPISFLTDNSATEFIVKASAGWLYSLTATNTLAAAMYVRVYDLANPDCTSATGIKLRFIIPAATTGSGAAIPLPSGGVTFASGISICATTTVSDTNNTAIASAAAAISAAFN